jgi:type I restriction enzyme M protein
MAKIEANINSKLQHILSKNLGIEFYNQSHKNKYINDMFKNSSKSNSGKQGYPDLIAYDEKNNLVIAIEIKPEKKSHDLCKQEVIHYLKTLTPMNDLNIIFIAHSGDEKDFLYTAYKMKFSNRKIIELKQNTYDNLRGYILQFQDNSLIDEIQNELPKLNNLMRAYVKVEKRALLFCGILMALYNGDFGDNDFHKIYKTISYNNLPIKIYDEIEHTLHQSNLTQKKIESFMTEFAWLKSDDRLKEWEGITDVIEIVDKIRGVIEFINVDILSDTFREMLRFATGDGQNFGQVMTPDHISELMVDITEKFGNIKENDTWIDITSGTGSLLLATMKKHVELLKNNFKKIQDFKRNNLYGIEIDSSMFVFGVTNMIINGDGKSNIEKGNSLKIKSFLSNDKKKINRLIINPPYSLKMDKHSNTIQNELAFLEKGISLVDKSAIIIAPMSVFRKSGIFETQRISILQKNTLKCLIRMPKNSFGDDANIHPAIAYFEVGRSHSLNDDVFTYDLVDDGLIKIKNQSRKDLKNRWKDIKNDMLNNLIPKKLNSLGDWDLFFETESKEFINKYDVKKEILQIKIGKNSVMSTDTFIESLDLLRNNFGIKNLPFNINDNDFNTFNKKLGKFKLDEIFDTIKHGKRLTKIDRIQGSVPLLTASEKNNGIAEYIKLPKSMELFKSNSITINMFGKVFYQDFDFTADDNIYIFQNKKLNKYNSIFLCAVLNNKLKYSFAHQFRQQMFLKEIIQLPVKEDNSIDWEWMEEISISILKEMEK